MRVCLSSRVCVCVYAYQSCPCTAHPPPEPRRWHPLSAVRGLAPLPSRSSCGAAHLQALQHAAATKFLRETLLLRRHTTTDCYYPHYF